MNEVEDKSLAQMTTWCSTAVNHVRKKRVKRKCRNAAAENQRKVCVRQRSGLLSLPCEMHLEILTYLAPHEIQAMRHVSAYFESVVFKFLKEYEISEQNLSTYKIIDDLKRLTFVKKIRIIRRIDCDLIVKQISLSNKDLEELYLKDCTGSTSNLYLKSTYLTQILQRCNCLHTINIVNMQFIGLKFYRLLGQLGIRLRSFLARTSLKQFQTFVQNMSHIDEETRAHLVSIKPSFEPVLPAWHDFLYDLRRSEGKPDMICIRYGSTYRTTTFIPKDET